MRLILSSGLSLIEVFVSLILLSLALLGLDAMLVESLQFRLNAFYASLAEQQLQNMDQRLHWVLATGQGLEEQIGLWNEENRQLLPQGRGGVTGNYPVYRIELSWGGNAAQAHGGRVVYVDKL